MNLLEKIVKVKRGEVRERKKALPENELRRHSHFQRNPYSLSEFLLHPGKTGIIAEFKRQSPSKGVINDRAKVVDVANGYFRGGASAISILTDEKFFGGSLQDLLSARDIPLPLLRKDFIIDRYQVTEAKAFGADVMLLIAACLQKEDVEELASYAKSLGLSVLLEIHNEDELEHICPSVDVVGVNNRNLKTFIVDIEKSVELAEKLPKEMIRIAESGIDDVRTVTLLKKHGFNGFLIGETFMKTENPGNAFSDFVNLLRS